MNDNSNITPEAPPATPAHTGKPTAKEHRARCEAVAEMAAQGMRRGEIHKRCAELWGVTWRSADRYLTRARSEAAEAIGQPKTDLIAEAYSEYRRILDDQKASLLIQLRAQDSICNLLGLNAPRRTELTGNEGTPLIEPKTIVVTHRYDINGKKIVEIENLLPGEPVIESDLDPRQVQGPAFVLQVGEDELPKARIRTGI